MINTITQQNIDDLFNSSTLEYHTFYNKSLVCACKLPSGFVIVEQAACVDPANFNLEMGKELAHGRIKNKLWELMGFELQQANFSS